MKSNYLNPRVSLRDAAPASDVKVFKAGKDGKPGKLLRIEKAKYFNSMWNEQTKVIELEHV